MVKLNYREREGDLMSVLINIAGAPGVGKSTLAAKLFYKLKEMGLNAELALEYCKGYAIEKREITPYSELYFFGKQSHIESTLFHKTDYIVSDSPTYLAGMYEYIYHGENSLSEACKAFYRKADKDGIKILNFLLPMRKRYNPKGRFQTKEQAAFIDKDMRSWLDSEGYKYEVLDIPDSKRIDRIIERLKEVADLKVVEEDDE